MRLLAGLTSTLQSEYAAVTVAQLAPLRKHATGTNAAREGDTAGGGDAAGQNPGQNPEPASQPLVFLAALAPPLGIALGHPGAFLTLLSVRSPGCRHAT